MVERSGVAEAEHGRFTRRAGGGVFRRRRPRIEGLDREAGFLSAHVPAVLAVLFLATACVVPPRHDDPRATPGQPVATPAQPPPPPGQRALLRWADVEAGFRGTFLVPGGSGPGPYDRFGYSSGIHAQLANGNLLVDGHDYSDRTAEVAPPAVLDGRTATQAGAFADLTGGLHPRGWIPGGETFELGGMLAVGERVHFTKHQWYNASGTDWDSLGWWQSGATPTEHHGLWNVDHPFAVSQRVAGYMSYPPLGLAAEGIDYLAGQQGTSGAATGRWGPNFWALDHTDLSDTGADVHATPLVAHSAEHPAPGWWVGNRVTSMQWIQTPTREGVVAFLCEGVGATWYGEWDEGPGGIRSVYPGYKGFHAEGYRFSAWIYDPADLLAVHRGERDPWSVVPVEKAVLVERLPGSPAEIRHGFLRSSAVSPVQASWRDGRLILMVPDGHLGFGEPTPEAFVAELG